MNFKKQLWKSVYNIWEVKMILMWGASHWLYKSICNWGFCACAIPWVLPWSFWWLLPSLLDDLETVTSCLGFQEPSWQDGIARPRQAVALWTQPQNSGCGVTLAKEVLSPWLSHGSHDGWRETSAGVHHCDPSWHRGAHPAWCKWIQWTVVFFNIVDSLHMHWCTHIMIVIMCSFLCHFSFGAQGPLHETK